jgi:hypothetical protein
LFEPIFHQFPAKIATFHPLWMNFGISRQTYDFTKWMNRKTSDWDTMLKSCGWEIYSKDIAVINKIEFSAKNLTSNAGLFL